MKLLGSSLACLLLGGGLVLAQAPASLPQSQPTDPPAATSTAPAVGVTTSADAHLNLVEDPYGWESAGRPRVYGEGGYLLWWIKDAPVPVPLVTTGDPNLVGLPPPGALGAAGTRVLYGNQDQSFNSFSGFTAAVGVWDACNTYGFEVRGFALEQGSRTYSASSNTAGNPPLYIPYFRTDLGRETAIPLGDGVFGVGPGSASVQNTARLWGLEANGQVNILNNGYLRVDGLVGFRYLDLLEGLELRTDATDQVLDARFITRDQFRTRNQFYGGQVGARVHSSWNWLTLDVTGKLALGWTQEVSRVGGSTSIIPGAAVAPGVPTGNFDGGIFALPSNSGRLSQHEFTAVPQVQVRLGLDLLEGVQAFVAYDFLYWSNVVRPGDQIDRRITPTQLPGAGPVLGEAFPQRRFESTDFYAHGLTFGVQLRY